MIFNELDTLEKSSHLHTILLAAEYLMWILISYI